ncbi:SAM domain and HD [Bulinus truncatus]|nr:SAM domain and HD [Bulinus truncatus]
MATKRLDKGRLFNDPVHGHINLNQTCQIIVDTKEFQRLRYLKQLGAVNYVFAGATHTRFEHSLGSYHLAGKFARKLQEKYPDTATDEDAITISDKDILCVEIAALCHDIGCAPFTKFFFERFLKNRRKKPTKKMFDYMFHKKGLKKKITQLQMNWSQEEKLNDRDFLFIEDMIVGYKTTGSTGWPYKGRDEKKAFLYEIVQNHRNGIDVCKWDYMDRDCRNLGITNNFDAQRYMEFARVIEVDGERQICTRKKVCAVEGLFTPRFVHPKVCPPQGLFTSWFVHHKEAGNLYNMFFTRYNLHKFAYQHPVVCGIELMLKDVFTAVEHVKIIKSDEVDFTIFECLEGMPAFASLTDEVLYLILHARKNDENDNASLKKAVDLLERLNIRDIYRFIEESSPMSKDNLTQRSYYTYGLMKFEAGMMKSTASMMKSTAAYSWCDIAYIWYNQIYSMYDKVYSWYDKVYSRCDKSIVGMMMPNFFEAYSVYCEAYIVYNEAYSVYFEAYSVYCEAYIVYNEAYSVYNEAYSVYCEAYIVYNEAYSVYCEAYIVYNEAYSVYCEAYIVYNEVYSVYFEANIVYNEAYSVYFEAYIVYNEVYSVYFEANIVYNEAYSVYFEANIVYNEAYSVYFEAYIVYNEAYSVYFEANIVYNEVYSVYCEAYIVYNEAYSVYFEANIVYNEVYSVYFEANIVYNEAYSVYFEANIVYNEAYSVYFEAYIVYNEAYSVYFEANIVYNEVYSVYCEAYIVYNEAHSVYFEAYNVYYDAYMAYYEACSV